MLSCSHEFRALDGVAQKIALHQDVGSRKRPTEEGYDPVSGVRPLKRVFQRALQVHLTEMILAGDFEYEVSAAESVGAICLVGGGRMVTGQLLAAR